MLGPIQPWGFFVASGTVLGIILGTRRCKRLGLDPDVLARLAAWILVAAFLGARLVHVFLYRWVDYKDNLFDIVKMWEGGLSSYGGFVGAAVGGIWFLKRSKLDFFAYADVASFSFVPAWAIGRIGCFSIHDHPGRVTDFFLGVEMLLRPVGYSKAIIQARHDLGLYDGLLAVAMGIVFFVLDKKKRHRGFYLGWMCVLYSIPRFFLDFLRATDLSWSDTRYLGLTPAQYGSIILLVIGGVILWRFRRPGSASS